MVSQAVKTIKIMTQTEEFMLLDPKWTSSSLSVGTESDFACEIEGDPHLKGDRYIRINVRLRPIEIGRYEDMLEIRFVRVSSDEANEEFIVTRMIKAVVGNAADYALLLPTAPYVPRQRTDRQEISRVISGVAPPRRRAIAWRSRLREYAAPKEYREICLTPPNRSDTEEDIVPAGIRSDFPPTLCLSSHTETFCILLWLEEIAQEGAFRVFDMESVTLSNHGVLYHLPIPGLAEKRPSVLIGDIVLVKENGTMEDEWFEGHVHTVGHEEVGLWFHHSFPGHESRQFDVRFQLNRTVLRRQHQALRAEHHAPRLLFPESADVPASKATSSKASLTFHDPKIENNPRQFQAVEQILALPSNSAPFIIFGPPGTGKTVTIVEAIKQILCEIPMHTYLPVHRAIQRSIREERAAPPEVLPYTFRNAEGLFSHPPLDTVKNFRVIVCTCISAGFTLGIGVERGHFSHVFIDEAGNATEPEAMTVVKNAANASTRLVLSGDPKQLRPIVQSPIANELGLGISYLERLMECDAYHGSYDGSTGVVKLLRNYRSHPTIIDFPSERFYDGELEAFGEPSSVNSCLELEPLVKDEYPVIFHAVEGQDMREASSPSFFTRKKIGGYYILLYGPTLNRPKEPAHIGIITPYRAQCTKLRTALRPFASEIKIGSVEEFQGDERRVIIITTVRSSRDYINYDLRHTLGFVANPRRFNVAVTRAKALLIIVGNPLVLGLDPLWRSYLNSVHIGGGWRGRQIPWDPSEPVNPDGGYDEELRARALYDADALAERLFDEADDYAGEDYAGEDQPFGQPEE
ncbi:P-loop containing nucleoside triphosphate hydrolase protein [Russula brevipes]|nr:P-loop containing nucleoside triphosphate hydrolase protein [Russula brevipes]